MQSTSASLLERLRHQPDAAAWERWTTLYKPFIQGCVSRLGVPPSDIDDVTQEVLTAVVRELPRFQHLPAKGAFRAWLRAVTVNRVRAYWQQQQQQRRLGAGADWERQLDQFLDPHSDLGRQWDQDHDRHVLQKLLALIVGDFEPATWRAFHRLTLEDADPAAVAQELGMTINAVYKAKANVLRRLREEAKGLVE